MLRLLFYVLLVGLFAYSALWLAEHPGRVVIEWQGYEITMQLGILIGMALCLAIILLTSVLIIRGLFFMPKRLREKGRIRRYEHAIGALNHTMTALALNDHREAARQLEKSRRYLKSDPPVTKLLGVQLAHASGKEAGARQTVNAMLEDASTRPVALRGKIRQLMQDKQWLDARRYAAEAIADRPDDHWLAMVMLDLLMRAQDWEEASKLLDKAVRKRALKPEQHRHYRAMLALARAQQAFEQDDNAKAQKLAELSLKEQKDLLPAHILLCKALAAQGEMKALRTQLSKSWQHAPHPALAALFEDNMCDVSPERVQKRLGKLIAGQEEHLESQLLKAKIALTQQQYDIARNALKSALGLGESPRVFTLFAQLERAEHGDEKGASEWLAQALSAPKDASWHCSHCGAGHEDWVSHCGHCDQFDATSWSRPNEPSPAALAN